MANLVRVRLDSGVEVSLDRDYAERKGLKVLDKPAQDKSGRALLAKYPIDLRGKELDAALDAAGLPKSGSAADKRQRLADHQESGADLVAGITTPSSGEPAAPEGEIS